MSLALTQLVASYEQAGMTPEQIAATDGYELSAVKAILFAQSAKYRADVGKPGHIDRATETDALDLTPDDETIANNVFRDLAQGAENEGVRLKAAMRIKDERRKRLDPRAGFKGIVNQTNIITLNEHFAKAAAALANKFRPAANTQQPITDI